MVIRLGGLKYNSPEAVPFQDLNDTNSAIIKFGSNLRTNYQILKQVGSFENGDTQAVDRYSSDPTFLGAVKSDGVNLSLNSDETTAVRVNENTVSPDDRNNYYEIGFGDSQISGTIHTVGTWTNAFNAIDGSLLTYANETASSDVAIGLTFSSQTIDGIAVKYSIKGGTTAGFVKLQYNNGSTWVDAVVLENGNIFAPRTNRYGKYVFPTPVTATGIRIFFDYLSGSSFSPFVWRIDTLSNSSKLIIDNTELILDGTEKLAIYKSIGTIPTNTSKSIVLSDGTNSTSSYSLDDYGNSEVIDISSLSSGTLEIAETLETTDTSVTPTSDGYSIELIR